MNPIRVLDLRSVDGQGGGAENIIERTAAAIDRSRVQMCVCCIRRPHDTSFDFDARIAATGAGYDEVVQERRLDRRILPALLRIIRKREVEIVHAHDYKAVYYASRLAREGGIVPMATMHGWGGQKWRERFVYYPAERSLVRRFPLVIAVSSQIGSILVGSGVDAGRVRVLLNGIDASYFRPNCVDRVTLRKSFDCGPGAIMIGSVGRLERAKRFDVLIRAVALLHAKCENLRLLIAGSGSLEKPLRRLIGQLGLERSCRLIGHQSDISRFYRACDVFVQSSDSEGSPTVLVEAMALQVPIVATEAGGTCELVTNEVHGLIVPRRDPAAIARAIERTLAEPEQTTKRVAAASRRATEDLSFARRTGKLEAIYQSLADRMRTGLRLERVEC